MTIMSRATCFPKRIAGKYNFEIQVKLKRFFLCVIESTTLIYNKRLNQIQSNLYHF